MTQGDGFESFGHASNPFADPRCKCPSVRELAIAGLQEQTVAPRCEVHQGDAIKANERATERENAQRHLARSEAIYEEIRDRDRSGPPGPVCTCGDLLHDVQAAFEGRPGSECALHRPAQNTNSDNNIPIGSGALNSKLAGHFPGAGTDFSTDVR